MADPIGVIVNTDATVTLYREGRKVWRGPVSGLMSHLVGDSAPVSSKKPARPKQKSRSARWAEACSAAISALEKLEEMRQEFEDWKDNLDGKFEGSALVEKLEAVCELDLDAALETVQEAEGMDLPLGFGRD